MTEEARKELYDITDRMAELEGKLQGIAREQSQIGDRVGVILARVVLDITSVKDQAGNPMYSDQQLREAAVTLRLLENEEYQTLKKRLWELDDAEKALGIELKRLADRRTLRMMEMGWTGESSLDSE